jgi:protein-glucosylgalactosylhydroxylysine glucosidase
MKQSRRNFIQTLAASSGLLHVKTFAGPTAIAPIDRAALVHRHSPVLRRFDPLSPLSVGNGEFAFTADVTGLQTFPEVYEQEMPLCTMSQWGWHSAPLPAGLDPNALPLVKFDTFGREVGYKVSPGGQNELYNWLRESPHRLHLGRVALRLTKSGGGEAQVVDITDIEQRLDLWTGALTSRFKFEGKPVTVKTAAHPALDLMAVSIESPLIAEGRLAVGFAFPYGSPSMQAADWKQSEKHKTEVLKQTANRVEIRRQLDADRYFTAINWNGRAEFTVEKPHHFVLTPAKQHSHMAQMAQLEFTAAFSPSSLTAAPPSAAATFSASAAHWNRFWTAGGAIEFAGSKDRRAEELERRIALSQYLTAIQCSGSMPPQETGLTVNSWYGKFHLEMHWWHAAHFALWNRTPMLEKSLRWYGKILPAARDLARSQGYAGARWPKMVGPEGADSPSPIGPLLIWQQPHPISYAELCYKSHPNRRTLERYRPIVFESAEFMASFAHFDQRTQRYVLGPPVIPAQENHPPRETWNPTFELAYWSYGLKTAQRWRERLGMKRNPKWDDVISKLSPLPASNGVYLAHENCPQTYTERNHDHPSMLAALGVLPGDGADREIMRRTLHKTMKEWRWADTWGWDYPMTAMTAARLGETGIAIDALLLESEKNRYLPNGHNWQRRNLPCYLPGNGGLLYAVAMMAAGWRGAPASHAPGFPSDGSWTVRWERLNAELIREI